MGLEMYGQGDQTPDSKNPNKFGSCLLSPDKNKSLNGDDDKKEEFKQNN